MNAPLIEPGRQIGLLSLHAGQPQAFSGETIQMVREAAAIVKEIVDLHQGRIEAAILNLTVAEPSY